MKLLEGKKALILGVANDRSIAWGITKKLKEHGASVALSFLNEALEKRVVPLASEVGADFTFELDVQKDDHYPKMIETIKEKWGKFDILIHSLAFADKNDLSGSFSETSRAGFTLAMDISAYSLISTANALKDLFNENGSIVTMTYYGAEKVIKNYNVMGVAKAALEANVRYLAEDFGKSGIRVNAISAGPIKTLAASGIAGFRTLLNQVEELAPLKRNVTPEDVGGAALFLTSSLGNGVTGQTIYVDSGLSIMGGF